MLACVVHNGQFEHRFALHGEKLDLNNQLILWKCKRREDFISREREKEREIFDF